MTDEIKGSWYAYFVHLDNFIKKNKRLLNVCDRGSTLEISTFLWLGRQKQQYIAGVLSQAKIDLLLKISLIKEYFKEDHKARVQKYFKTELDKLKLLDILPSFKSLNPYIMTLYWSLRYMKRKERDGKLTKEQSAELLNFLKEKNGES